MYTNIDHLSAVTVHEGRVKMHPIRHYVGQITP